MTRDVTHATERARRWRRLLLLGVWGLSAVYALQNLNRGWIPHDEGTIAESAERVMDGQLPHRDYDELYTGGESALNALAFRVLGVNLLTPRLVLYGFFLAWVPVVFWIASQLAAPPLAVLATLLAVSWSLPNYPAAMPSWYNLFFALFGLAGLLRYTETGRGRWLLAAGLAGGLSVLVKTSGLFFVAGVLLFLAYREQELSSRDAAPREGASRTHVAFSLVSSALLACFVVLLSLLVTEERSSVAEVLEFIVPLGGLAAFVGWSEWTGGPRAGSRERFRTLGRLGLPFMAGFAVPVAGLVLFYAAHGALGALARGLFETPARRLAYASTPLSARPLWIAVPLVAVLALDFARPRRVRLGAAVVVLAGGVALAVAPLSAGRLPSMPMWYLLNSLGPVIAVAGLAALVARQLRDGDGAERRRIFATLCVAGGAMLIQFPFSGPIYLFYALPALVPAALALHGRTPLLRRPVFASVVAFLLLFTVRWANSGELFKAGHFPYDPTTATARLDLPRGGGLRVSPYQKEEYERLVLAMQSLSTSRYTFATPDLPQVYFLSGLRNPTRTLFDFFEQRKGRSRQILRKLDAHHVNVVVLNRRLTFSGPPPPALLAGLRERYPDAAILGDFILRWRPGPRLQPAGSPGHAPARTEGR